MAATDTINDINQIVTLADILEARDRRSRIQTRLRGLYPDCSLICVTIVSPGKVKLSHESIVAAHASREAIEMTFGQHIEYENEVFPPTGYEAFYVVNIPADEVKRMSVDIEDSHPLGRLFDIDVFGAEPMPISRTSIGAKPRTCLLCDRDARICMRAATHSYEEILKHIASIVARYEHSC